MRRRLRKKLHRRHLNFLCADSVTFDDSLRRRLLEAEPGVPFRVAGRPGYFSARVIAGLGLRYSVAVLRKVAPKTAVVMFWADEFPTVRDTAVIFALKDLGLTMPKT
jgi:hypothetical protein